MKYVIYGKYKECPKEKLETTKNKQVAEEYVSGYQFYLAEKWKVWMEETDEQ
jgi:hypothetical protein